MDDTPRGSVWLVIGAFALIGPYVGGLTVVIVSLIENPFGDPDWRDLALLPLAALSGYIFGIMPALVTGVFSGAVSSRVHSELAWVAFATVVGAAVSALTFATIPGSWSYVAPVGAVSALVSALVALKVRPRYRIQYAGSRRLSRPRYGYPSGQSRRRRRAAGIHTSWRARS